MPFDSPEQKHEALLNSRKLDVHRWSRYKEVNEAVDEIYAILSADPKFDGNARLRKKHIKVVILDLYACWLSNPARYIQYSRNKSDYRGNSRYNKLHISYLTVSVVDALKTLGLIEHHIGFHNPELEVGFQSRMRATDRLIALVRYKHAIPEEAIDWYRRRECIILRDIVNGRKTDIEYLDTDQTERMRKVVNGYNELLDKTDISIPNLPARGIPTTGGNRYVKPSNTAKFVRRIFNNGSWDDGGRFYGGWWQSIPSDWRVQISMDGSPNGSVEIDYSGHHIVLLYALKNLDYCTADGDDPYTLNAFEHSDRMRGLLKLCLLIMINAKSKRSALSAIRKKLGENPDRFLWVFDEGLDLKKIVEAFAKRHRPIEDLFFSGMGIKLQRLDSDIAERVIRHFTRRRIPVLCIHDSFLINPEHEEELKRIMLSAMDKSVRKHMGGRLRITTSLSYKRL